MSAQSRKNATDHAKNGTIARRAGALDDLAVFVTVAQQASFVGASRRLAIPTSSVSRAVARLEEELGVPLLRRTSRTVTATEEGRALLLHAAGHLEALEEALLSTADRRPEPSGVVRVTAPSYTGSTRVARALAAFALAHPKIAIELDATNAIRDLLQDGFDIGIRTRPDASPDVVARRLWQTPFGLFASRDFVKRALRGKKRITREALERTPCVVMRATTTWRFRDASGEAIELAPCVRFAVNDPRGGLDVARQGLGIVLAPIDVPSESSRELVRIEPAFGEPEPMDLYLVYPTRRLLPLRVRMTIDWLLNWDAAPRAKRSR